MNMEFNHNKIKTIESDGVSYDVENLPRDIQREIELFDNIKYDMLQKDYALTVVKLALEAQRKEIESKMKSLDKEQNQE